MKFYCPCPWQAINGGVCKFNVNTDVRNAAMSCLQQAFDNSDEVMLEEC